MKIRTSAWIPASREALWPLLTNSRMDLPGWFCLGLPQPVACELPDGTGGVGAERRCISDRGTVVQRITCWEPHSQLRFSMVTTDHRWERCVEALHENFILEESGSGTRITRTTQLVAKGGFSWFKELGFCIGLKRVHLFVFKNWKTTLAPDRISRDTPPPELEIGQQVRVILNARNRTPHEGPITDRVWHYKDRRWNYSIESQGKRVSKRYYIEDLESV